MFEKIFRKRRAVYGKEIEPEEIFMDSLNLPGHDRTLQEGRIEYPLGKYVFSRWGLFIGLALGLLLLRLFQLQYIRGNEYLAASNKNISYTLFTAPPRGFIYDRNMRVLASNSSVFSLVLKRNRFKTEEGFSAALAKAAALTGKYPYEVWLDNNREDTAAEKAPENLYSPAVWPEEIVIDRGISREILLKVATGPDYYNGFAVEESIKRVYAENSESFSHVVGFTGWPTKDDQLSSPVYRSGTRIIGKSGIELKNEEELRGKAGIKIIEIDSGGRPQRERFIDEAEAGAGIVLNIDAAVERQVYEIMSRHLAAYGKKAGAVILSDPRDGRILALVSFPGFDAQLFSDGRDRENIKKILNSKASPFLNRAISGIYAPGSTIKPVLAVGALEEGVIDPLREIYDEGFISVPNPYDPEKFTVFKDWTKLGWVNMRRAIAWSANVYFYTIGGGYGDIKGLGIERIRKFLNIFGFGSPLGIDIAGEKGGLVPGPEEKKRTRPRDPFWRIGDTYITSIGQGDMGATPLQVNFATMAIANGGTIWRPFIASKVVDASGNVIREVVPQKIRDRIAGSESLAVARQGMRLVVTEGSAKALSSLPVEVAGKTGTAQTGITGKNHGWFTGWAPYENPEVVVTVLVEEGTGGSTDAVPIAKEVFYAWLANRK